MVRVEYRWMHGPIDVQSSGSTRVVETPAVDGHTVAYVDAVTATGTGKFPTVLRAGVVLGVGNSVAIDSGDDGHVPLHEGNIAGFWWSIAALGGETDIVAVLLVLEGTLHTARGT